jgi:hypothetical protein
MAKRKPQRPEGAIRIWTPAEPWARQVLAELDQLDLGRLRRWRRPLAALATFERIARDEDGDAAAAIADGMRLQLWAELGRRLGIEPPEGFAHGEAPLAELPFLLDELGRGCEVLGLSQEDNDALIAGALEPELSAWDGLLAATLPPDDTPA